MANTKRLAAGGGTTAAQNREERTPEDKRQRILSAAKSVFLKYGYGRVTMHDLAHAAGMSRPALYLVFSRKEDIFRGVVREFAREISREVKQGLESIQSPLDKLKFVCEVWMVQPFDWISQSAEAKEIFESIDEFAHDEFAETLTAFERDLASVIELFPKGTLPKGISSWQAARLLAAAIGGVRRTCGKSAEFREKVHSLIAMMIRT